MQSTLASMKNAVRCLVVFLVLTLGARGVFSQGCSDAGFCTMGGLEPHASEELDETLNSITFGLNYGFADNSITVLGFALEYSRQITSNLGVDVKFTSLAQSGNGVAEFGLSDVYVSARYGITSDVQAVLGGKIPLMRANTSLDGLALPMDYQSSLGTYDAILGVRYVVGGLQVLAAAQLPLVQNQNAFLSELYPAGSALRSFQSTNAFNRSADVLLRASYPLPVSESVVITPSVLPIYHLAEDTYTTASGVVESITGSRGLTLNVNVFMTVAVARNQSIQLSVAAPLIVRQARPDGLTRSFLANIEYAVRF